MVRNDRDPSGSIRRCLVVGNYCHDVLIRDDGVAAESLGGAASFISGVLDGLSVSSDYISKVGSDFAYEVNHPPILSSSSKTTLFHAYFYPETAEIKRQDRILKRVVACDPLFPSDLPESRFDFGMAVGVAGEISPETLERMLDLCEIVFVDIQALIRAFDPVDGTVHLIGLKESGFFHLLPRIGFLKASAEEAGFLELEEARKWCCVVVTNGKEGCTVYRKDDEFRIPPFPTVQVDPTGAGDSFLGAFAAGLAQGLPVADAALLGNFFGSLTVGQIGLTKFDSRILQRVKDEVQRRKMQYVGTNECNVGGMLMKPLGQQHFIASLDAARMMSTIPIRGHHYNKDLPPPSPQERLFNSLFDDPITSVEGQT